MGCAASESCEMRPCEPAISNAVRKSGRPYAQEPETWLMAPEPCVRIATAWSTPSSGRSNPTERLQDAGHLAGDPPREVEVVDHQVQDQPARPGVVEEPVLRRRAAAGSWRA